MSQICLILFGAPGSGKGTQAKLLHTAMVLPHISTGDMLRESVERGDDLGHEVQSILRAGSLVPDEIVNDLVSGRISRPDCKNGFILDGYPRTVNQAQKITHLLDERGVKILVIHLKVDYNVIVERLAARRQCPVCGAVYGARANGPISVCGLDGARLAVREDDRPETVRRRLMNYDSQTAPVLEFFETAGYCRMDVDGDAPGGPQKIAERLVASVRQHFDSAGRGA